MRLILTTCSFYTLTLSCFVNKPASKAPPTFVPPAQYNNLPPAAPSPSNLANQPNGSRTLTCGHSKYWNTGTGYEAQLSQGAGIVNGVYAMPNEFPFQVYLEMLYNFPGFNWCGGIVINTEWVLTAAHCVDGGIVASNLNFGEHNRSTYDFKTWRTSRTLIPHPNYNRNNWDYDYALIKITVPINFTTWNIQPICLPDSCASACQENDMGFITGWGTVSSGGPTSDTLVKAKLPIVSTTNCAISQSMYAVVSNRMICAGYDTASVDTCQGDSGGPLFIAKNGYFELCGVTSHGRGCATAGTYGVYSKVCVVRDWIRSVTGT